MSRSGAIVLAAMGIAIASCGGSAGSKHTATGAVSLPPTTPAPTPSPTAAPTPKPDILFGVLVAHGDHAVGPLRGDTVVITGIDGMAKAKATFTPHLVPDLGPTITPQLFPEARVAGNAVYFVDGKGVVRKLTIGSTPQTLVTFPLTTRQQVISFAVSPDGTHFVADVMTAPVHSTSPACPDQNDCFVPPEVFSSDVYAADASGSPKRIAHSEANYPYSTHVAPVGWDSGGALVSTQAPVVVGGSYSGGGGGFGQGFSTIARLGADGQLGIGLGGSGCVAVDESVSGNVACTEQGVSVRSVTGASLYSVGLANRTAQYIALSPDGNQVAASFEDQNSATPNPNAYRCIVQSKDGTTIDLPADFRPEGWLDATTIIGIHGDEKSINAQHGPMAVVRLSDPTHAEDLGFKGSYLGLIQGS